MATSVIPSESVVVAGYTNKCVKGPVPQELLMSSVWLRIFVKGLNLQCTRTHRQQSESIYYLKNVHCANYKSYTCIHCYIFPVIIDPSRLMYARNRKCSKYINKSIIV